LAEFDAFLASQTAGKPMVRSLTFALVLCAAGSSGLAEEPLHRRIDGLISAAAGGELNPPATDASFVRRIYLDLAGRIPSRDETKAFLDDAAADTRANLIHALLASPHYAEHMSATFHVLLTERLGEHELWHAWLREAFATNKPWDQMCREMLAPHFDEADPSRGAGMFVSKRLENYGQNPVDYPALVRDVGRLMLGVDLQCAQCHDHPQIEDYKQVDYQGLYAYFANVSLRGDAKFPAVQEKLLGKKLEFQSVFILNKEEVGPRLPFGMEIAIPAFASGEEFELPPDKGTKHPGVLKFSTLKLLAEEMPKPQTPGFSKNIANRLWWQMMGRGLVHPLDLHHSGNPASHPELLDLLASELAARQFDMKWLLREIALSEAYQRSSELPPGVAANDIPVTSYRVAIEKGLSAEQVARSLWIATGQKNEAPPADLVARCVKALAQPPREPETEFAPSVKGALFLSHDSVLLGLLERKEGALIDRLMKLEKPETIADELFLSLFSRQPREEERVEIVEYLQDPAQRETRLRHLAWAMLTSGEFALNH
jgi:hypothetical protein